MQTIGHQKIIKFLEKSIERKATSTAYLFLGSEHLGKFMVALDFAEKITGALGQEINPDIIIIRPTVEEKNGILKKKDIKVEQIRDLQKDLSRTPYFGKCKVAIIDDAERLTIAAQNALLKTLEEPDEKSILILAAHNQEKILPTIRSRAVVKNFNAVSGEEIARALPAGKMSSAATFWSLGRPGLALELSKNSEDLQLLEKSKDEFAKLFTSNLAEKFVVAESLSQDTQKIKEQLESWTILLRQNIKAGGSFLQVSQEKTLEIIEKIAESLQLIRDTNSNARVVLENLFLKF